MKKNLLLLFTILYFTSNFAQAPQAFKFQTVVRDGSGEILPLQDIILKFQIHIDDPEGDVVYSEQHFVVTNGSGLVSIDVGMGEILSGGSFADIIWGEGEYFIEELIDIGSAGVFQVLGTFQLMSVPYALYANSAGYSIQTMTTEERDAIENPALGMQIYNISTQCLNYFGGTSWFETCGDCTPMPSQSEAGVNQDFTDETLSTYLEGNAPEFGVGTWSIMDGNGGVLEDEHNPATLFTGIDCEYYLLKWAITNPCGTTSDYVSIEFNVQPTLANAGEDQLFANVNTTTLDGNTPYIGEGQWIITSGTGGFVSDPENPNSDFSGQPCETYTLQWAISTLCNSSNDEVEIKFGSTPTTAYAGEDQVGLEGSWTTLEANDPLIGDGLWTILQGEGGQVTSPNDPTSIFLGQIDEQYALEWQISTVCDTSRDAVNIGFGTLPITCGFSVVGHTVRKSELSIPEFGSIQTLKSETPYANAQANKSLETNSAYSDSKTKEGLKTAKPLSETLVDQSLKTELALTKTTQNVKSEGGITSFTFSSSSAWSAKASDSWLSVEPSAGGSTDTILTVVYKTNISSDPRTGHIAISTNEGSINANVSVSQAGRTIKRGMNIGLVWICGLPFRDYRDSTLYSTIQIGNQCWMAKNLNIGNRVDGHIDQANNGTIEKYCFGNDEANCEVYGGLYQWDEMMQYTTNEATNGICPDGWYLPTDSEWCALEQEVDPRIICSRGSWRGDGIASKLKHNGDIGFKVLLAGTYENGSFFNRDSNTAFWSSSEYTENFAWIRSMDDTHKAINRTDRSKHKGYSVRCIKHN